MEKEATRQAVRGAIAALSDEERANASRQIARRVTSLKEYQYARTVLLFLSMPDEVDTGPILLDALRRGLSVAAPRVIRGTRDMVALPVRDPERDIAPGAWGIPEPVGGTPIASEEIDFVLVPGLAFDRVGHRLGRGAGFYDRFMSADGFSGYRCAIAFDCQIVAAVPVDLHDIPVQCIVTEAGITYTISN